VRAERQGPADLLPNCLTLHARTTGDDANGLVHPALAVVTSLYIAEVTDSQPSAFKNGTLSPQHLLGHRDVSCMRARAYTDDAGGSTKTILESFPKRDENIIDI
jgi:hypothetical protein